MSELIVVTYEDQFRAEEIRVKLLKLQKEYLIDMEDAVVAVKKLDGKIKLHQMFNTTVYGTVEGSFWGLLIGCLFLNPLFGIAVGAAAGAISGALADVGINDKFMKELSECLKPGSSALFVLVRKATPDKVIEELQGTGGKILKSSLTHNDQDMLQSALNTARKEAVVV